MSKQNFEDIKSFEDRQVKDKLQELKHDREFYQFIADLIYPKGSKFFSAIFQFYIKKKFIQIFGDCDSIEQFQDRMAPLVESMIAKTTDGFSYSGEENLSNRPTLFIGNHRDISLDPAFLNYLLYSESYRTVRIAIGDNLLDGGFAENLMRLNKSFVVHRDIKGIKETLRKLSKLSAYISHSLFHDNESIWIAQKEGRANDGNDYTDEAVLKMLYLHHRKDMNLNDWIKKTNLTPVSISYEYDPLDVIKAKGWDHHDSMSQQEINQSDLKEMATGIFGFKGKVHLHICKPIDTSLSETSQLAASIEKEIIENYKIWPVSYSAICLLKEIDFESDLYDSTYVDTDSYRFLQDRTKGLNTAEKEELLLTYARPLINKEKARLASGP